MSNDQSSAPVIWEQKFKHLTLRHCEPSHSALASADLESSCRAIRSQRCVRCVLFFVGLIVSRAALCMPRETAGPAVALHRQFIWRQSRLARSSRARVDSRDEAAQSG
jgi:hypothetical protein